MKIRLFLKFFALIATSLLSACSSVINAPTEATKTSSISHTDLKWQQHISQLNQMTSYKTKGQFGYISKQPKERFSANFDWKYDNKKQFLFYLSSSLSNKTIKLEHTSRGLTLSDQNGNQRTDSDANDLLKETLGFSFPIESLGDWLKGLPPENRNYIVNAKRQLAQFNYPLNGVIWIVNYIKYHENKQPNLPELIILENGNQTLKIRIDDWILK